MKKPEILAPVGKRESLIVAINNGADAVYLGIENFNARGNIENFTLDNLKEAVTKAHLFGVKVYLTLNILFKDSEFEGLTELVEKTSKAGVDAYIIQDIGLYFFLKHSFPNLELHASTQMGIQNFEGAKFIKELGYKRIVLARETPLRDIKEISEKLKIDIEYFVQGALCVSFSGNCYLCSHLASCSGNRGKCKQFCRLPYKLYNEKSEKEGYLLSTRDFCMLQDLKNLAESGVTSFKIEGRARREAYVGQAVSTYKKAVLNNFSFAEEDKNNLKKVFNRGDYIRGYLANEKIIYSKAQNHIGVEIGKVLGVKRGKKFNEIKIKSSHALSKDDVLKFFVNEKEMSIMTVKDFKENAPGIYVVTTTNSIPENSIVRLIVDAKAEEQILSNRRVLEVYGYFYAEKEKKAKLKFVCNETAVEVESDFIVQEAKNSALSREECFLQISKLGEEFSLKELDYTAENVFIAKSQLNNLRRECLDELKEEIVKNYENKEKLAEKAQKSIKNIDIFDKNSEKINIVEFDDFEKLDKKDLENDILIYKPNELKKDYLLGIYEKYKDKKVFVSLPIIATQSEVNYIKEIISLCDGWGVVANNYYALEILSPERTIIGAGLNVYNSYAVKFYLSKGYKNIILSDELNIDDKIFSSGANIMYHGEYYPEYMYFAHCPIKENIGGDCSRCLYSDGYKYKLNNTQFRLIRKRILKCHFVLKSQNKVARDLNKGFNNIIEK